MRRLALAVCLLVCPAVAHAQTCIGAAPLDSHSHANAGLTLDVADGLTSTSVDVRGGSRNFGGLSVGFNRYTDLPATSLDVSGVVGAQVAGDRRGRTHLCPLGLLSYERGPNGIGGSDLDHWGWSAFGGLGFSVTVAESDTVAVAPFAGLLVGTQSDTLTDAGGDVTLSDTFGVVLLGGAITLKGGQTITPAVTLPFLVDGAGLRSFRLIVSFPLGRQ